MRPKTISVDAITKKMLEHLAIFWDLKAEGDVPKFGRVIRKLIDKSKAPTGLMIPTREVWYGVRVYVCAYGVCAREGDRASETWG